MKIYRITKFNPAKRHADGHYLDTSEWTSISDVGKTKYNNPTYAEYEKIEAIGLFVEELNKWPWDTNDNL